ncbi:uncharacterized protein LOC116302907 [Actinia tenebrosa]|uniref:Uncharacterized protein LOC116302907 n=1 Tax=Actinia tenebrosa TaxID=6105 RepID=A0A6P8IME0_ACTTE|nr:uncharacterized protein LOC116302907 [Actinia tenebrosa]
MLTRGLAVLFASFLVLEKMSWSNAAPSLTLTNNYMDLKGNAHIKFFEPREKVWAGLAKGHRFPVLYSGDLIALRMAYTSGSLQTRWISCSTSSYCVTSTCPGGTVSGHHLYHLHSNSFDRY